jgi:RP/EB family microtubule-associated protein
MSQNADAAIGMMDAAYFTGRKELLDFFNDLLDLNLKKIEETAPGAIACQLTELIFPGSIPLSRVSWEARTDYEFVQNYKLLQVAFTKHRVQRFVDVDKLIRAKYQDNLEFCQWLKAFYDQSGTFRDDYDPAAARAKGKGGKKFNAQHSGSGSSGTSMSKARPSAPKVSRPRPVPVATNARPRGAAMSPTAASMGKEKQTLHTERTARPLRERVPANEGTNASSSNTNSTSSQQLKHSDAATEALLADAALMKKNVDLTATVEDLEEKNGELTGKVEDLEKAVIDIETERDFYFSKLRSVEVMLQVHQEQGEESDPNNMVDKIFQILYATAEDGLEVNDQGDVVQGVVADELAGEDLLDTSLVSQDAI